MNIKVRLTEKKKQKFYSFYKDYDIKEDKDIESIIEIIINNRKTFDMGDIGVTNKIYIPFGLKQLFTKSYIAYTNKNMNWEKIIGKYF